MAHECILRSRDELRDDEFVEAGGDDADFDVFRYDFSFVEFHDAVPFFAVACLWVLRQLHSEHVPMRSRFVSK